MSTSQSTPPLNHRFLISGSDGARRKEPCACTQGILFVFFPGKASNGANMPISNLLGSVHLLLPTIPHTQATFAPYRWSVSSTFLPLLVLLVYLKFGAFLASVFASSVGSFFQSACFFLKKNVMMGAFRLSNMQIAQSDALFFSHNAFCSYSMNMI